MRIFLNLLLVLLFSTTLCFAQRNPTMTSARDDADREQLYARFLEHKKVPIAERQKLAYEAARDYVRRYSGDQDSKLAEMRRFVTEYERVLANFTLHEAFKKGNHLKTFEVGRSLVKKDPENFYALATLSQAGYANAQKGDVSLNEETIDYTKRALAIAESDNFRKPDPFANAADARGFLNFALGWFLRAQSPVEAAEALVRAVKSGSSYKDDPLTYNLLGIAILKGEYAHVSAEYNTKFGNKPPSPEQQAMLQQIIKLGNRAVDAYARAVALSTKPEQQEARAKMMAQLVQLYKSFHEGSDTGLNELIAGVLAKPLPE
ncbi:MAG TPA: hypothetical protein VFT02_12390 [Pyrinomonadaceae bacterium]|nr:hypothetical protein [Pyrinomonadaceae bacterium]